MIRAHLPVLGLLMLLATSSASGQAPTPADNPATPDSTAAAETDNPAAPADGGAPSIPSAAAAEPEPPAAVTEQPGDYRASEQISEDLSVSYPIDI